MAFVAVLPTAGTILGGLGAAASAIPIIGPTLGAIGGGLGGAATALGAGNIMGAASSLGSGLMGGLGGLYTGADKILGGFLPNLGGFGIAPAQGFLGHGANALGQGNAGLGLLGGPGQFLGPGGLMGPSQVVTSGVPAMNGVLAPGVSGSAGVPAGNMAFNMGQQGLASVLGGGGGGAPAGGVEGFLGNMKAKVDPVLGPITKVGVGAGQVMDVYNKITGNDGGPMPGTNQTPAQAAQNPQYNPYVPTTKAQPIAIPVNVGAAAGGGPTSMAVPTQQVGGAPVAAYVPMEPAKSEDDAEEELEELKNMLAMQGNFLSGVVNRTA
jgi:hypothetical protein